MSQLGMGDSANYQTIGVRVNVTSTSLHSLTTLYDPAWIEAARVLVEVSLKSAGEVDRRLIHAFRWVVARPPSEHDLAALRLIYGQQLASYRSDEDAARSLLDIGNANRDKSLNFAEHAALAATCLGILSLNESRSKLSPRRLSSPSKCNS